MSKTFYWLKLKQGYFASRAMKKMRKSPNGEVLTIIYLKLQLEAIASEGIIPFYGFEDDIASELSLIIDEEPEDIQSTLDFLLKHGMATLSDSQLCLPEVIENTGKETDAAERMRRFRARQSEEKAERNNVTTSYTGVTNSYTEKENREEKELKEEREKEGAPSLCDEEAQTLSPNNKFTLEAGWDYTLGKYPRKTNLGNAHELWIEMVTKISGAEKETAKEICDAVKLFATDYHKNNPDDPEGKFVIGFERWLKEEAAVWIKRLREIRERVETAQRELENQEPVYEGDDW